MKYQLKSENFLEWLALAAKKIPKPLLDITIPPMQAKCLMLAVRLGVFRALDEKPKLPQEIADECKLDPVTLTFCLKILVASDYLKSHKNGRFSLTKQTRASFLPSSKKSVENVMLLGLLQWQHFDHLEEMLKTGRPLDFHYNLKDPRAWEIYQSAMLDMAKMLAVPVSKLVPVKKGASCLLDMGGSHGLFGAMIARRHALEKSIVIDLPEAIESARPLAKACGVSDIVEFRPLDLLKDPVEIKADVVFFGNILHHFNKAEIKKLLQQAKQNLTKGGTIAILEISVESKEAAPDLVTSAMSLFFRLTSASECYSADTYYDWLKELEFKDVCVKRIFRSPVHRLICARL